MEVMSPRLSLTTSSSPSGYSVVPVDVSDVHGLRRELEKAGARRWALYWRDALGDGHAEGKFRMLDELQQSDFEWLLERRPYEDRQVLYDTKVP